MEDVEQLRTDHALLRRKALLLEAALQVAPQAPLAVREISHSLQRLLEEHCLREEPLLRQFRRHSTLPQRLGGIDHATERQLLQTANELLAGRLRASLPLIILRLSQAVEQLKAQMDKQQRTLLPLLAQRIGEAPEESVAISGAMSVNEVLHRYPDAQPVFDRMHIQRWEEGADSVDEVAWRHGMDAGDIMEQLREAVAGKPSYWFGE